MPLLAWNPDWETGIRQIDQQHRELFAQVEILMNAIHNDEAAGRIPNLLKFLANYVDVHFQDEETAMKGSNYPGLASHQAIHDDMRGKVAALLIEFQKDPTVVTDQVLDFISEWLVNHINGEDRRMARHLIQWNAAHARVEG
jgi:hemerythrin-like metal-binding protein